MICQNESRYFRNHLSTSLRQLRVVCSWHFACQAEALNLSPAEGLRPTIKNHRLTAGDAAEEMFCVY